MLIVSRGLVNDTKRDININNFLMSYQDIELRFHENTMWLSLYISTIASLIRKTKMWKWNTIRASLRIDEIHSFHLTMSDIGTQIQFYFLLFIYPSYITCHQLWCIFIKTLYTLLWYNVIFYFYFVIPI